MKHKLTATATMNCTGREFEDTLYNSDLVVVQKDWNDHLSFTQAVYVFANVEDEMPIYGVFREITEDGSSCWKETYNA